MIFKKFHLKTTAIALSLLATPAIFAEEGVKPAQAIYQDDELLNPIVDQPISFTVKDFKTNFEVHENRSVFEVEVPGLYAIDSFLLVNIPNVGDAVSGYITINEKKLLPFFKSEIRTDDPIFEFHFKDRHVYLEKGDKVSVILSEFVEGTTVLSRGFVMVALNNSR